MKKVVVIQGGIRNTGTSNTIAQSFVESNKFDCTKIFVLSLLRNTEKYQDILKEVEVLVFVVPCYVNTLPYSDLLALDVLQELKLLNKQCYVIAQGGMPYSSVHQNCVDVLALFAKSQGWIYRGSMIIGIGPLINGARLEDVMWYGKRMKKYLQIFQNDIQQGVSVSADFQAKVDLCIPLILYKVMAKIMNYKLRQQHKQWGYDPYQTSPYAKEEIK